MAAILLSILLQTSWKPEEFPPGRRGGARAEADYCASSLVMTAPFIWGMTETVFTT